MKRPIKREVSVTGTKRGLGIQFARDLAELGISVTLTDTGKAKKAIPKGRSATPKDANDPKESS